MTTRAKKALKESVCAGEGRRKNRIHSSEEEKFNLLQPISEKQQTLEEDMTSNQLRDTLNNQSEEDPKLSAVLVNTEDDIEQWEEEKSTRAGNDQESIEGHS